MAATPLLVARLQEADDVRRGHLAVLLGLLAEASFPETGGDLHAAVRRGLPAYLRLVRRAPGGGPLSLALLYLLAHFPGDREAILGAVADLDLDAGDRTRLDRALRTLDRSAPDLGRCWPAPSVWSLDESERRFDRRWIQELTAEQLTTNWNNDTHMVLAYSGAKAYWAVTNDSPVPAAAASVDEVAPSDGVADVFRPYAGVFRCPRCAGRLAVGESGAGCGGCGAAYPIARGILDLSAAGDEIADTATADLLRKLADMPSMGLYYESVLRPAFLDIAGTNWGDLVSVEDEDAYLAEHVWPVDGPVLDLAAGAGRWTAVIRGAVGPDRLIALDAGPAMLSVLRRRLPDVPAVLGDALRLPFDDGTLGAVTCWNALQAFPESAAGAIAEVGRCLRPGGTFTLMTFRYADDPIGRYFQVNHHFPSRPEGMMLFELEEIEEWLHAAGMTIIDCSGPGTFLFVTAARRSPAGR
ncbi:MAG TPA: class I SAM-dependent methyltransferase [Nonomuraea sp.]|nr:class I SAM-dependent methyltransferase [Nonomuraea sp.]